MTELPIVDYCYSIITRAKCLNGWGKLLKDLNEHRINNTLVYKTV